MSGNQYGGDNILPKAKQQREALANHLSSLAASGCSEARRKIKRARRDWIINALFNPQHGKQNASVEARK